MVATFHTPADVTFQGFSPKAVVTRILAALLAADARARTRSNYERMLASPEILRDVGVSAEDVRRAMAGPHME